MRIPARLAPISLVPIALAAFALLTSPAGAHGDEGTMEVLKTDVVSPTEIEVEVGIVYANDDDLATEANVMVTATGPSGELVGPINLPVIEDARYGATITVPGAGAWTLAITSDTPVASSTAAVDVPTSLPPSTEAPATSDGPPTTGPETTTPGTDPPESVTATDAGTDGNTDDASDDGGGGSIIGYVVVVLAIAGVTTTVVVIRGRRRATSDGA